MDVTILGSGPASPRPCGASSGYLIQQGDDRLLVDCGHGIVGALTCATTLGSLDGIFISHMDPDHYFDLVPLKYGLLWAGIRDVPLLLPPGGHDVLKRLEAAVLTSDTFFSEVFAIGEYNPREPANLAGFAIRFAPITHPTPGFAMRFSRPNGPAGDLVYSADTAWSEAVTELMKDADLALIESTYVSYPRPESAEVHLTAALAGDMAAAAGVKRALLIHYGEAEAEEVRAQAAGHFPGPVELAVEGTTYPVEVTVSSWPP
jgi:ribonuclease BN (tRNA processing enzyme)